MVETTHILNDWSIRNDSKHWELCFMLKKTGLCWQYYNCEWIFEGVVCFAFQFAQFKPQNIPHTSVFSCLNNFLYWYDNSFTNKLINEWVAVIYLT